MSPERTVGQMRLPHGSVGWFDRELAMGVVRIGDGTASVHFKCDPRRIQLVVGEAVARGGYGITLVGTEVAPDLRHSHLVLEYAALEGAALEVAAS